MLLLGFVDSVENGEKVVQTALDNFGKIGNAF